MSAKWGKGSSEETGIEEYISRVNKINEERIYCNKFLQQYSALYFRKIEHISLDIKICDESDNTLDRIPFTFRDDTKGEDFFHDADVGEVLKKYAGS